MARVKNRKGSGDEKCSTCGTWLKHWENGTGQPAPAICGANGCNNQPVLGGHVIKVGVADTASYITPICAQCNARTDEYDVAWTLYPASAGVRCR